MVSHGWRAFAGAFAGGMMIALLLLVAGCGSGTGGGGSGGAGGTSSGGAGSGGGPGTGGSGFMAVAPCAAESDYSSGDSTITFGAGAATYAPKCLQVSPGTAVTFAGDFTTHPLEPSGRRGTLTSTPITATTIGTSKAFTFSAPGFYAYFCSLHGTSDSGAGMAGVVWVK